MRITSVKTYLMNAAPPGTGGWSARNWLFVKISADEGLYGIGEASGWPRVVQMAIEDLAPLLIGEDPMHIERITSKLTLAMMGHGMTGVVGRRRDHRYRDRALGSEGQGAGLTGLESARRQDARPAARLYARARAAARQ